MTPQKHHILHYNGQSRIKYCEKMPLVAQLTNAELLAILIGSGRPGAL